MADKSNEQIKFNKNSWTLVKWVFVLIFAIFSVVLLVAEKTAAGVSLAGVAVIMTLPLGKFIKNSHMLLWVRIVPIIILSAITVISIASTDLRPAQEKTGYAAIDKISAIIQEFSDKISGESSTSQQTGGQKEITQETANKFADCMRSKGLSDLPDPQLTEDGISFDFSKVSEPEEVINKAQKDCSYILEQ